MSFSFVDRKIKLFNVEDFMPLRKQHSFTCSPDGTFALIWNLNTVEKICLTTRQVIHRYKLTIKEKNRNCESIIFYPDGKYALICDTNNHCIHRICLQTDQITLFAGTCGISGNRNGPIENALFSLPCSLSFSPDGTYIIVCDYGNECCRRISTKTGYVTTREDIVKSLSYTFSPDGSFALLLGDHTFCIRKVCIKTGYISIFAGIPGKFGVNNGSKEEAKFSRIKSVVFSPDSKFVFVLTMFNIIRKICISTGMVSNFAGIPQLSGPSRNGPKEQAKFEELNNISISPDGIYLFLCDKNNIKFMKIKNSGYIQSQIKKEIKLDVPKFMVWNGYEVPSSCTVENLKLAKENFHPRDQCIIFDDAPHKYYINGVCDYTSCTTFIHHHFPEFDPYKVASRMTLRDDFNTNPRYSKYDELKMYHNYTVPNDILVSRIIESWNTNGTEQSCLGTQMHRSIELMYNDETDSEECIRNTTEYGYFENFHAATIARNWKMFRTEMIVWDEDSKLCGSIDAIYLDTTLNQNIQDWRDGKIKLRIRLVDWKRSKEIRTHGFQKFGYNDCSTIPDCNYNHYKLQLNLYKYMLETKYNVIVDSMCIVVCHPNADNFKEYTFTCQQNVIKSMIKDHCNNNFTFINNTK